MNLDHFLREHGASFERIPQRESCGARRVAPTLDVPISGVVKTILLRCDGGSLYAVAVLPATGQVDLEKAARLLGVRKAEVASDLEIAQHCPDCEMAVLPPFGSQYGLTTLMDSSLTEEKEMVFAGQSHGDAICMRLTDFLRLETPLIASVTFPVARAY